MSKNLDRIGFLIHLPELFNHFHAVWQHLPPGSVEIAVTGLPQDCAETIQTCERLQLPWRYARDMLARGERFDVLISNHPTHDIRGNDSPYLPQSIGKQNLRFMYATGKAGWNFQRWNEIYDAILCFGPYQAEKLDFCSQTLKVQMGYPRFDRFFNQPVDRERRLPELGCDPTRKTIVWLPTWKDLCSIDLYAEAIAKLQASYNVIVKPHPITITSEPARMQKLAGFRCCITETFDNVELFQLADYLLCDYGGSAFGGIYTDSNVILLDLPNAERDAFVGTDSPDIWLRRVMPHIGPHEQERLPELLEDEQLWQQQGQVRFELSQYFFAPYYGYAAQVAALSIANAGKMLRGRR
jgi:hypothetical protein